MIRTFFTGLAYMLLAMGAISACVSTYYQWRAYRHVAPGVSRLRARWRLFEDPADYDDVGKAYLFKRDEWSLPMYWGMIGGMLTLLALNAG